MPFCGCFGGGWIRGAVLCLVNVHWRKVLSITFQPECVRLCVCVGESVGGWGWGWGALRRDRVKTMINTHRSLRSKVGLKFPGRKPARPDRQSITQSDRRTAVKNVILLF